MEPTPHDTRDLGNALQADDLHPSLLAVVQANSMSSNKLTVGLKMRGNQLDTTSREDILVEDGTKNALWRVPSLRALFRGDKPAPVLGQEPPPTYMPWFYYVEHHLLTYCAAFGDRTDTQMEETYSNLRRRPDGKSLDPLHFFMWQVAAGLVGTRCVSAAEFEAVFERLALSASHFRIGPVSRNYVNTLHTTVH
jgi:hypothetical protein